MIEQLKKWLHDRGNSVSRRLDDWYQTAAGQHIQQIENRLLADGLASLFGYHLVSLQSVGCNEGVQASPIMHRVILGQRRRSSDKVDLRASLYDLPLQNDSVDVLVLPHVLEFYERPHAILREAERVIHPNGHLVILGFNPISCMGLCRLLLGLTRRMPWQGHYYHPYRVCDWAKLLGFEPVKIKYALFTPPLQHRATLEKLGFVERLRSSWLAPLGGTYLLVARNLAVKPNILRPKWSQKATVISNSAAEPSGRISNVRSNIKKVN